MKFLNASQGHAIILPQKSGVKKGAIFFSFDLNFKHSTDNIHYFLSFFILDIAMTRFIKIEWFFFILSSLVFSGLLVGQPGYLRATDSVVWFSATGDLRGEIKPCGCSPDGDMGGLLRRAMYLEQRRQAHPHLLYLDLGNNFPPPSEQGRLKVDLIQKSLKHLEPVSILVGPNELLYEISLLDKGLPYLLTNARSKLPFKKLHSAMIQGKRIGILGYLSPTQIYQNENEEQRIVPVDALLLGIFEQQLQSSRLDYKILMFRGNEQELEQFEKSGLFDLIIAGNNNDDELNQVLTLKTTTGEFYAVPTKGQGSFEGGLDFEKKSASLEVDWFLGKYKDHPKLLPLFQAYDKAVKELFFTNLDRMEKHQKEAPYAGEGVCQACHQAQHKIWRESRHSQAFATLKKVKKHFDLECLQCHVVGLNKGGFLSPQLTSTLMNVQCENCHGAGKAHISNPTKIHPPTVPAKQACVSCHKGSHSPKFDFAKYWLKIKH